MNRTGMLRAVCRRVVWLVSAVAVVLTADCLSAQDFLFGRSPSGSASEVIDTNANGLGVSARFGHVAGNDVGRRESLSMLELTPFVNIGDGLFFGDTRLGYANNGELVWSAGAGYRHYITAWDAVLGGYGYYDWDEITGAQLQQWSYGVELLSRTWEARANVYRPYGDTSAQTGSQVAAGSQEFVGNRVVFSRIDSFAEALQGFDAEIGFLLPGDVSERFDLRAFGGGYAYKGKGQPEFAGFSMRLQADIADWLELGLKLSDDEVLHTNVSFSAIAHFGGYHSQAHTSRSAMQRMAEPVRRNLNIAAAQTEVTVGGLVANGLDGDPLNIIHVNSNATSPGTGTVDDPFRDLLTGLAFPDADVVFTHAGSSFTDQVVLQPGQNLFGEGFIPSSDRLVTNTVQVEGIGELTLPFSPTFASNTTLLRPMLNGSADPAVQMSNSSRFGGFIVDSSAGVGVLADGISDIVIRDILVSNAGSDGILLNDTSGTISILDSVILNARGSAFHVVGGDATIGFNGTSNGVDPSFAAIQNNVDHLGTPGPAIHIEGTLAGGSVNMTNSTTDDDGGQGVIIDGAAGNATLDNISVTNSMGSGIQVIGGSSGTFTFRNTLRPGTGPGLGTSIQNPTDGAIVVDGLTGELRFQDINIVGPAATTASRAAGIDINAITGRFFVDGNVDIGPNTTGGMAPYISMRGSAGAASFAQNISINAGAASGILSGGRGIEITGNLDGNSFAVLGQATVVDVGQEGIAVVGDPSSVVFGAIDVREAGLQGLLISGTTGPIQISQVASVEKTLGPALVPAVDINGALGPVAFDTLQVNATNGDIGVSLVGNNGPLSTITANTLNVNTAGGIGLFANDNTEIRTSDGIFTALDAPAIDILESGINIRLSQVNSENSPTFGIRLRETNKDLTNHTRLAKSFVIQPGAISSPVPGDGGLIVGAAEEGVLLENAGQVQLTGVELLDNLYGIRVANSGLREENGVLADDQFLLLLNSNVLESDFRGLDSLNLKELDIRNSLFDDNGDLAVIGRESIVLQYDEFPGDTDLTTVEEYGTGIFTVNIQNSQIIDNTDDGISISNSIVGAPIRVDIVQNSFTLNELNDFDGFDQSESAIEVFWNGPARINVNQNDFTLAGTTLGENQTAFFLDSNSSTDFLRLFVTRNTLGNSQQPGAIGIDMETRGPSISDIEANTFVFEGFDSQGMQFNLAEDTLMNLVANQLRFESSGGFGMEFLRVNGPSQFQFSGNLIQLTDAFTINGAINDPPNEEGIRFRTISGTINLFGNQNNIIELISAGGDIDTFFLPNQPTPSISGQIIVNGVAGP